MKWLNRILGRKELPSTVAFDEIDAWLESASKSLFCDLSRNADRLYEEMRAVSERLEESINILQNAEPDGSMPAHITKIGLQNRDKMVKHLHSLGEKISIPTQTDYRTILSFYKVAASSIELVLGKLSKNIYYVRSLFPDEVKEVTSDLNQLKTILNQLVTPIKGKESRIMSLEQAIELVRDIKDLKSRIDKEREKVCEQEGAYSALKRRIEMEGERLRRIEEGEEWKRFKELEGELSSLEMELNALESEINQLFSPINKALNLLKKRDEAGRCRLTPDERRAISSILSSPVQAFDDEEIRGYLLTVKHIIERDASFLKDRRRDKTLRWIDHLLNTGLSSIRGRREILRSRVEELKGELSDLTILEDRKKIEESILSGKGQLIQLQEGIDRSKRYLLSLEEEIREKAELLLEALEGVAGRKIDVKFGFSDANLI
ncbi:MAG TPA: hypothetical protein ENG09_02750 [Candidatus Syntrophoarchaeum butanivorans]|uniref:Pneumococcal surface protein n=1 Tax=Candidatus Syntropharchaeum butanivorans TaxID=1839936 RepID=A0A7C1B8W3_9EURY|nr:hypothetical protein [Candidatus Syntrophoarchaeum butanivorans]